MDTRLKAYRTFHFFWNNKKNVQKVFLVYFIGIISHLCQSFLSGYLIHLLNLKRLLLQPFFVRKIIITKICYLSFHHKIQIKTEVDMSKYSRYLHTLYATIQYLHIENIATALNRRRIQPNDLNVNIAGKY